MGGGEYNYLGIRSVGELIDNDENLARLDTRLQRDYPDRAVTAATRLLLRRGRALAALYEKLALDDVWNAVEWYDSDDATQERLDEAITRYDANAADRGLGVYLWSAGRCMRGAFAGNRIISASGGWSLNNRPLQCGAMLFLLHNGEWFAGRYERRFDDSAVLYCDLVAGPNSFVELTGAERLAWPDEV